MKLTALIIFIAQAAVPSAAFAPAPFGKTAVSQQLSSSVSPSWTSSSRLFVSSSVKPTDTEVPITVTGNNIDVTDALVEYVQKKLERPLGKLRANGTIRHCDVHLSVNKNPKVRDFNQERRLSETVDRALRCRRAEQESRPAGLPIKRGFSCR